MNRTALAGLCKIELPDATVRLCDGGLIRWAAETFVAGDATYGTLGAVEAVREGLGSELPPVQLVLIPPDATAAAVLVDPAHQGSRVRFWIAEFDVDTGAVIGTPDLKFDGELDQSDFDLQGALELTVTPRAARLFELNIGNSLSPAFHKSVWPGETGHDNATGLGRAVAWGVESPVSGAGVGAYSGGTRDPYLAGKYALP